MAKFTKSYEIYDQNLLLIRWLADFIGLDMMADNYKFNYRTGLCFFLVTSAFGCSVYTMFHYYPDYYKMCEAFFPMCASVQGTTKFYYGYIHRHFYQIQYKRLRNLHYNHRNHEENHAKLLWLMEKIYFLTKVIAVSFLGSGLLVALYPICMYLIYGERVLIIAMLIPGIDETSYIGHYVTLIAQVFMAVLAVTGFAASEVVILLYVASLIAFVDVFTNDLDDLNLELNKDARDEELIHEKNRSICVQHQEIIEYQSDLDERYFTIYFVQIVTGVAAISALLFNVYVTQFFPGYIILILLFGQLLESCLLGVILTVKNEEITEAIYRTEWYLLEKPEQKCFMLMLHKSQHFVELTIGGFAPLNLETFVSIMNKIYSYFMMLINFIE